MWKRVAIVVGILILIAAGLVGVLAWQVWQHPLAMYEKGGKRALESAGFVRSVMEADSGQLSYWKMGSGPALIFLHGAGDSAGSWSRVAPRFTDEYTVYVPDLPGHGASEPAEGPLPLSVVHKGISSLVEVASAGAPVTLVGNSLGAWLAMLEAVDDPGALRHIVLVNGGGIFNDPGDLTLLPADRAQARRLITALRDPSSPAIPDFVLDDIVKRAHDGPIRRMTLELEDMQAQLLDGRLAEITTPVDLVWGLSDHLMSYDYAVRLAEGLPASRLSELEACGHVPQNECPEPLVKTLRGVLAAELPVARTAAP